MKKLIALLLTLILLAGCSVSPRSSGQTVLYYPAQYDPADPQKLITEVPYKGVGDTAEDILADYFAAVTDPTIVPFPSGVSIHSLKLKEDHATIVLSDQFAQLSGVNLTRSCICITRTVSELTGVSTVTVGCKTELIDGEQAITFSNSDILWIDEGFFTGITPTTVSK